MRGGGSSCGSLKMHVLSKSDSGAYFQSEESKVWYITLTFQCSVLYFLKENKIVRPAVLPVRGRHNNKNIPA